VSDPLNKMSQVRRKGYQRQARVRKFHEGLTPWAQRIPWGVLGGIPKVLCVTGVIAAVAGLSVWAMAFPLAAGLLQGTADLPRRRRSGPFRHRLQAAVIAAVFFAVGGLVAHEATVWLAAWSLLRVTVETAGWALASFGAQGLAVAIVVLSSLMAAPLSPDEARFPRSMYVQFSPDVLDALHGIVGDQLKQRVNAVVGEAVMFYANHLAGCGLDREPEPAHPQE
jgi:hypothetical protein